MFFMLLLIFRIDENIIYEDNDKLVHKWTEDSIVAHQPTGDRQPEERTCDMDQSGELDPGGAHVTGRSGEEDPG